MALCSFPMQTTMAAAAEMRDRGMISPAEFQTVWETVMSGSGPMRTVTPEVASLMDRVWLMTLAPATLRPQ